MIICLGATPTIQRTLFFSELTLDEVNRAAETYECASGKSVNVARVLHTLGVPCHATGFAGGRRGVQLTEELRESGISTDFISVVPQTRLCTTVIDRKSGNVTELVEESRSVPAYDYQALLEQLRATMKQATMLILSGSLTPGAPQDFYAKALAAANQRGVKTLLDARGVPLELALPLKPWLVKPNRSELAATVGAPVDSDASLRAAIVKLLERGAQWAVITHGARPAVASDGKSFWRITSPTVEAVNPIGSGDSFAAGLAAAVAAGKSMPDAFRQAAACGAANALTKQPGFLDVKTMRELESRVIVEPF